MKTKLFKILKYTGIIIFILLVCSIILVSSSWFQNWLADKAAKELSQEIGTHISIDKIGVNWNGTIDVKNIYIEDQSKDTLFYIKQINAKYGVFNNEKRIVQLSNLSLEDVVVNFVQHEGEDDLNYQFFFDYFAPKKKRTGPPVIWTIAFDHLKLANASFLYKIEGKEPPSSRKFDENHMLYSNIYGEFEKFEIIDDSLDFKTINLKCIERSGLVLEQLSANTKIHWKGMSFENMFLKTEHSTLQDKLTFKYENWRSFSDFIDVVYIQADLKESLVSTKDIAIFTNNLKDLNYEARIKGNAYGTIASFDAEDVEISTLSNTFLKGDFSLSGLPDFKNTFMDFTIRQLRMTQRDLNEIVGRGSLPDNIQLLGNLNYKGNLTGFSKDFVSYGNLNTNLGTLTTDINLKLNDDLNDGRYSGDIKSESFDLGKFLNINTLGKIAVNAQLKGHGFNKKEVNIDIKGDLDKIEFNNYTYHVTKVEGNLTPNNFKGLAIIKDENVDLDFDGIVDFTGEIPKLNFNADVRHANLMALNLDSSDHFSAKMTLDLVGFDIDNFSGSAQIDSIEYKRQNLPLQKVNFINLNAYSTDDIRNILLKSDIINAEIKGKFIFKEMVHTGEEILHELLPQYFQQEEDLTVVQDFVFKLDLLKPEVLTSLFAPDVIVSKGWIKGEFESETNKLNLRLKNNALGYKSYKLKGLDIDASKEPQKPMFFNLTSTDLLIDSNIFSSDITFKGEVFNNKLDYFLNSKEKEDKHALTSTGDLSFKQDTIDLHIGKSDIYVLNERWELDSTAFVSYSNNTITIKNLLLQQGKQLLEANGTIGEAKENSLRINTRRFDLSTINNFFSSDAIKIKGIANGDINLANLISTPYITTDLTIQDLAINKDTIGDLLLESKFVNESKSLDIHAEVKSGILHGLKINGLLNLFDKKENFNLALDLPTSGIEVISNFTKGLVSDISGSAQANLKLKGSFKKPLLTGQINLVNSRMKIDYLNTSYNVNTKVNVAPDGFYFDKFKIFDDQTHFGWVNGKVLHNNFSDFNLDLMVNNLKNFLALNTSKKDNDLFYGKIYMDGNMTVKGPISKGVDMIINATSKKGTEFYLPIDDSEGIANSSFITFKKEKDEGPINTSSGIPGINFLQINADLTTDAQVEIIFDEQVGDKISGEANGKLTMELDDVGDFYLKGAVEIEQGKYLFTSFDVINKNFIINKGSRIVWTGDPYKAMVDITASFMQLASSKNLVTTQSTDTENTNYVDLQTISYLYLKGNLFTPDISFGLDIPSSNSISSNNTEITSAINQIKNDPEELNRQVFSLLIFGQFLPPSFSSSEQSNFDASAGLSTSVSDLISNQVGNWLSAIDDKWKVNIDYNTGSSVQKEEFILGLGRKFINDRLEILASYNTAQTNTPNFDVQYSLTKDGKFKVKAYSKSSVNIASNSNSTTQGVGFFFKKDFNRRRKRREQKKIKQNRQN